MGDADDDHFIVAVVIIDNIALMEYGAKTRCKMISGRATLGIIEQRIHVIV